MDNIDLNILDLAPRTLENKRSVAALIVTYNPDGNFVKGIKSISTQVSHVLVIDNGSSDDSATFLSVIDEIENSSIISNNKNIGLASALNQGVSLLKELGYRWVITLDQDSIPASNMTERMLSTLNNCSCIEKVAFVGANIKYENMGNYEYKWLCKNERYPFLFKLATSRNVNDSDVTSVITSGSLTNISMFQDIGAFKDKFFIDCIDTEYSLRAKKNGYRIIVSVDAILYHNLGNKTQVPFLRGSITPNFHKPFRRYYIARNQVAVLQEYAFIYPHWLLLELVYSTYNFLRIFLFEDQKKENFIMIVKGYYDGIMGKFGEIKM